MPQFDMRVPQKKETRLFRKSRVSSHHQMFEALCAHTYGRGPVRVLMPSYQTFG